MPSEYECWCYMTVIARDGEVELVREADLPIPPFPGLRLIFDDEEGDYFDGRRIECNVRDGALWLFGDYEIGDDQCCCGPDDGCCVLGTGRDGSWLGYFLGHGWEIHEQPRYGKDRWHPRPWAFNPEQNIFADDETPAAEIATLTGPAAVVGSVQHRRAVVSSPGS